MFCVSRKELVVQMGVDRTGVELCLVAGGLWF